MGQQNIIRRLTSFSDKLPTAEVKRQHRFHFRPMESLPRPERDEGQALSDLESRNQMIQQLTEENRLLRITIAALKYRLGILKHLSGGVLSLPELKQL